MPILYDFLEGLDPTPFNQIDQSQLLQMIRQAEVQSWIGLIYYSTTAPDVVNNPRFKRYFWADISTDPYLIYVYKISSNSWVPFALTIPDGSITANLLANQLNLTGIPGKIKPGGGLQLLRTNAAGNGTEWWTLSFSSGSIDIASLKLPFPIVPGQFLRIKLDGSAPEWFTFAIADYLTIGSIPLAAIQITGVAKDVIAVSDNGLNLEYRTLLELINQGSFPINRIAPGSPNTYLQTNSLGTIQWGAVPTTNIPHGRTILAGSGNYVVPANVYSILVQLVGGGAGGADNILPTGIGGGGGGYCEKLLAVTPGQIIAYSVGTGSVAGHPALDGGDTTFGVLTANGGKANGTEGSFAGGDFGVNGFSGGSTFPKSNLNGVTLPNLRYAGGKSGFPYSKGGINNTDSGETVIPVFGGGGCSYQAGGITSDATVAQAGADGAIIITY